MAKMRKSCFCLISILITYLPFQMTSNRYSEIGGTLSDQNDSVDKTPRIAAIWWDTTINRGGGGHWDKFGEVYCGCLLLMSFQIQI